MSIPRNTAHRALLVLGLASLLGACSDEAPLQPRDSAPPVRINASTDADLARALALGLGDPAARTALRDALRDSPLNEHKLVLQDYIRTPGGERLLAAAAERSGLSRGELVRVIESRVGTDFYVPFAEHRANWRATDDLLLGYTGNVDSPLLTAFGTSGASVQLDARAGTPARPLVLLHPGEPKWTRPGARPGSGDVIERAATGPRLSLVDEGGCGGDTSTQLIEDNCEGSGGASGPSGPTATLTHLYAHEGDWWGDIEIMVKHYQSPGGTRLVEWIESGFKKTTHYNLFEVLPAASGLVMYVKVWERDSGIPETSGDDFWGERYMAGSGFPTFFGAPCYQVHGDNPDWENICGVAIWGYGEMGANRNIPTVDLTYVYTVS